MTSDRYNMNEVHWPATPFDIKKHAILVGKRGSEAHGTYVPPTDPDAIDDRDIMAICVPPLDLLVGIKSWEGKDEINGCWDVCLYSLQKYMSLLVKQNPNVITLLWLREEDYLLVTEEGQMLRDARDLFRSKAAFKSFVGYANGQLHRMTHFEDVKGEQPKFATGYMGAKRKALVEKYGYDTKNAAHLVRLLKMGIEFLRTGQLNVWREHDREEILSIKQGKWEVGKVGEYASRLFKECHEAMDACTLPDEVDREKANALCVRTFVAYYDRVYGGI